MNPVLKQALSEYVKVTLDGIEQKYGTSRSGNYGHSGIPGHVGGSGSGGGKKDEGKTRNFTDVQLISNLQDQRLLSSIYEVKPDFTGMSVEDRLRFAELNTQFIEGKNKFTTPHEFAFAKYDFELRSEVPEGLSAEALRMYLKEHDLTVPTDQKPSTYYPKIYIGSEHLSKGFSEKEKDEFIEKLPLLVKKTQEERKFESGLTYVNHENFSIKQLERLSDLADKLSGNWWDTNEKNENAFFENNIKLLSYHNGLYSSNKGAALTSLLSGWASAGGTIDALLVKDISAKVFSVNEGRSFYSTSDKQVPKYSDRLVEHIKSLKSDTEQFYKDKFKKKDTPIPDLSKIDLIVGRGVGGHSDNYTAAAAESWSTDKGTPERFGKMMAESVPSRGFRRSRQFEYSILSTIVSYNDILFSYESVKGKYGWPEEKDLKGKKEFVVLGGAIKPGSVSVQRKTTS